MKLDAWLREDHSLDAKLRVVERLCQAVNGVHDDGEALGALDPSRIEIGAEGRCDLAGTREGSPAHAYRAPDREAGAPPTAADIYAAGAIAWEMLAGRPPGASPPHLAEVRPGLDHELSNAVMACLEPSAEWRPKDLTYLAQMAAARQKKKEKTSPPSTSPRAPLPPRRSVPRPGTRRPQRRTWPLVAALVLVAGLAFIAGRQLLLQPGDARTPSTPPGPTPPASVETPAPRPLLPTPTATPVPVAPPAPTPQDDRPVLLAPPGPESPAPSAPRAAPKPTPLIPPPPLEEETHSPATRTVADPAPAPAPPTGRPRSAASPTTASPPAVRPATPAEPNRPPTPPVLTTVSPLQVRSPGMVLIDLHGRGFRPQHRARVLPVKKVPWGISVVRQKYVGDSLITVLLELKESVEPGEYALAVEDGLGTRTEPVIFEVTR
jgi:hypothetical protein